MIFAEFFYLKSGKCVGFRVSGHSYESEFGHDLLCCAVSASVQLCCNGITEILNKKAKIKVADGLVEFKVLDCSCACVQSFLKALQLQLVNLSKNYSKNLKLVEVEV